ncbi:MAG: arylsulfotransferase family protein [Pseudomonadota bacterium]
MDKMLTLNTGVTYKAADHCTPGYVLFAPVGGNKVFLIDYDGAIAHEWTVGRGFTFWCYLLPDGTLFVNERSDIRKGVALTGSGLMRQYDWEGKLLWEHYDPYQHHDARRLEGGGAAYLAYTALSDDEQARVVGGVAGSEAEGGVFGEAIREVDEAGRLVWEWNLSQLGYDKFPLHPNANRWSHGHTNTIQPLPNGTYLVSCKVLNLIFIVDRETGRVDWHYQNDDMGGQHDAQMLDSGNILVFANGAYASDLHHSQVWEIDPRTNQIVWRFHARDNPQSFFSPHIGGCQRLPSGNTLVCEGAKGCVFETTPDGDIVWEYVSPHFVDVPRFGKINWLFRARHYMQGAPENGALA